MIVDYSELCDPYGSVAGVRWGVAGTRGLPTDSVAVARKMKR
jgi:hypothetical protein